MGVQFRKDLCLTGGASVRSNYGPAGGTVIVLPGWIRVRPSLSQHVRNTTVTSHVNTGPFLINVNKNNATLKQHLPYGPRRFIFKNNFSIGYLYR